MFSDSLVPGKSELPVLAFACGSADAWSYAGSVLLNRSAIEPESNLGVCRPMLSRRGGSLYRLR